MFSSQMSDMSWPEVQEALKRTDIVLFPVGSIEQHSTHLPLNNDIFTSFEISKRLAQKLAPEITVLVAPPLPYGLSPHHMDFPGTVSLTTRTFIEVVKEVCRSLATHGLRKIVIMNGHGGNTSALHIATTEAAIETKAKIFLVDWWELVPDALAKLFKPPFYHACDTETSMVLALGQRVDIDKAKVSIPQQSSKFVVHDFMASGPKVYEPLLDMKTITQTGAVGDPTKATREKGQELLNILLDRLVSFIKELRVSGGSSA
jgi:creatinine amidohydrolase